MHTSLVNHPGRNVAGMLKSDCRFCSPLLDLLQDVGDEDVGTIGLLVYLIAKTLIPDPSTIFCPLEIAWLTVGCAKFTFSASTTVVIPSSRAPQ